MGEKHLYKERQPYVCFLRSPAGVGYGAKVVWVRGMATAQARTSVCRLRALLRARGACGQRVGKR